MSETERQEPEERWNSGLHQAECFLVNVERVKVERAVVEVGRSTSPGNEPLSTVWPVKLRVRAFPAQPLPCYQNIPTPRARSEFGRSQLARARKGS